MNELLACRRGGLVLIAIVALGCESRALLLGDGPAEHLDRSRSDRGADPERRDRASGDRQLQLQTGKPCAQDGQCSSGHCSDGFCCSAVCSGPCRRCNEPGLEGTCFSVSDGAAPPPGKTCAASPVSSCGLDGSCDGRGNCRRWPAGSLCKPAQCEASLQPTKLSLAWHCDGMGSCLPLASSEIDCSPYGCDTAHQRCFSVCSAATPLSCKAGVTCDAAGRCGGALPPLGASCGNDSACASGKCVESVCCDGDCTAACSSCALAGSAGRCVAVAAGLPPPQGKSCPVDPLKPCANDGKCDGTQKCRVAPAGTPCGQVTCQESSITLRLCNGDTSSPACISKEISCGLYSCQPAGTGCYVSCTSAAQCKSDALCVNSECVECVAGSDCEPGEVCVNYKCI